MSIRKLKREAEDIPGIQLIIQQYKGSNSKVQRILKHLENHHFLRDHIQDLAYSLLELKIAVFRKEYTLIHRLLIKFTKGKNTSIRDVREELVDFEDVVHDVSQYTKSKMVDALKELVTLYQHLLNDIERLFKKVHKELEGTDVGFDEAIEL